MTDATKTPPATGTFCWNECLTTDVEAAKTFYTGLMGWTTREMDMGPAGTYTLFVNNGQEVAGMMKTPQEGMPSTWLSYLAVDDVDASTTKAEQLGAKVCMQPTDIPNVGRFSVLTDPAGAAIALFKHV